MRHNEPNNDAYPQFGALNANNYIEE